MNYSKTLDKLAADLTGFDTFGEMLDAQGGYRPTILPQADDRRYEVLADAYDGEQAHRGNNKRAWRGYREDQQAPALLTVRLQGVPAQSGLVSDWLKVIWQVNTVVPETFGEPFVFYYGHGGWTEEYPRFRVVLDVTADDDTTTPAHATITAFTPGAVNLLQDAIAQTGVPVLPAPEATRKCAAWLGCGNLAVPVTDISFRGFCPECEAVANGSDCDESCQATHSL